MQILKWPFFICERKETDLFRFINDIAQACGRGGPPHWSMIKMRNINQENNDWNLTGHHFCTFCIPEATHEDLSWIMHLFNICLDVF